MLVPLLLGPFKRLVLVAAALGQDSLATLNPTYIFTMIVNRLTERMAFEGAEQSGTSTGSYS